MAIFDFLKKKKKGSSDDGDEKKGATIFGADKAGFNSMLSGLDTSNMTKMQKMALKMFQRLPANKQEEMIRKAMNPQAIYKNKDKVLKELDEMVKSGRISKQQAELMKGQLGLR